MTQRQTRWNHCLARMRLVSYLRLGAGLLFLALLWLSFGIRLFSPWFSLCPVVVWIGLVVYHDRLRGVAERARRATAFYQRGLERIENRWQGKGNPGTSYGDDRHLYAKDLDLFGRGSLYDLLCTARTVAGEQILAAWLLKPASKAEILKRQQAVDELRGNIALREDLALLGTDIRSELHPEFMSRWANAPLLLQSTTARVIAGILVGLTLVAFLSWAITGTGETLLLFCLTLELVLSLICRGPVRMVLAAIDEPAKELATLGLGLRRMEREVFSSDRLRELQTNLSRDRRLPSEDIASFTSRVTYLNQRRNQFFALISFPLLWATQFAFALEAWRRRCGPMVASWFENFGEFEALCALAGYAYEHPGDPFPEIVEGAVVCEGEELRHPLLPRESCVPNSVRLGGELQLLLVSGSNMSGKSTLLRTVGMNVVLAQAGAPVRAARMKLCVFAIGATLRVQDSLQAGISHFYAEIRRLHATMELTGGPLPVLFLLDEILQGTNSHDRAIGAEAVVRGLIDRGAIGLVTTHDLALARVAEALAPRAANVHFEDHLENGQMVFDYVLRTGVVQKSNALELMRAVGLSV